MAQRRIDGGIETVVILPRISREPIADQPKKRKTGREAHLEAVRLETTGNQQKAANAYRTAAAAYSIDGNDFRTTGRLLDVHTSHLNSAAEYHNQARLETDEKIKAVARKNAALQFEEAAKCAYSIGCKINAADHSHRAGWFEKEAIDYEKAAAEYAKLADPKESETLLRAAVARLRTAFETAYDVETSRRQIQTASEHMQRAGRQDLTAVFSKCDTWDKLNEFTSELDIALSVEAE